MRSAATKFGSTPNSARYSSYAARLGKLNSASALSLAPSAGRKYPWWIPPCPSTSSIQRRAKRSKASIFAGSMTYSTTQVITP
jgi:hypothetical protein